LHLLSLRSSIYLSGRLLIRVLTVGSTSIAGVGAGVPASVAPVAAQALEYLLHLLLHRLLRLAFKLLESCLGTKVQMELVLDVGALDQFHNVCDYRVVIRLSAPAHKSALTESASAGSTYSTAKASAPSSSALARLTALGLG